MQGNQVAKSSFASGRTEVTPEGEVVPPSASALRQAASRSDFLLFRDKACSSGGAASQIDESRRAFPIVSLRGETRSERRLSDLQRKGSYLIAAKRSCQ